MCGSAQGSMWSPNGYLYRSDFTRHSIKPSVALELRSTIRKREVSSSNGNDEFKGQSFERQAFDDIFPLSCGTSETCFRTDPCRSNLVDLP